MWGDGQAVDQDAPPLPPWDCHARDSGGGPTASPVLHKWPVGRLSHINETQHPVATWVIEVPVCDPEAAPHIPGSSQQPLPTLLSPPRSKTETWQPQTPERALFSLPPPCGCAAADTRREGKVLQGASQGREVWHCVNMQRAEVTRRGGKKQAHTHRPTYSPTCTIMHMLTRTLTDTRVVTHTFSHTHAHQFSHKHTYTH